MKTCVICKETDHKWTIAVQPHKRGNVIALLDALSYIEEACKSEETTTFIDVMFSWIADDEDRDSVIKRLEEYLEGEVEYVEKVDYTTRLGDILAKLKEN